MKIKLLGIDLAKNVFQICALNQANKVLFNHSFRRAQFRSTIAKDKDNLHRTLFSFAVWKTRFVCLFIRHYFVDVHDEKSAERPT